MNPQIQKLADKVGLFVDLGGESWPRAMAAEESVIVYQKFAELIVQECIRLCDQVDIVGADECIDNIKQHFGVEQ